MSIFQFIIYFLTGIIMNSVMIYAYRQFSCKSPYLTKINILIALLLTAIGIIINFYNLPNLKFIFSIFLSITINWVIFKDNLKNIFYYTLAYSIHF